MVVNYQNVTKRLTVFAALWAALMTMPVRAQTIEATTQALSFGTLIAGGGGTVRLAPSGGRTVIAGSVILPTTAQFPQGSPAWFKVSGNSGQSYSVTLPSSGVLLNGSNGGSMTLSAFSCYPSCVGTFASTASDIYVGGDLTISAGQPVGNYVGSYSVTVGYQ